MADISQEAEASLTQANTAPSGDTRPVYEIGYHLVPTLAEGDVAGEVANIRSMLGDAEIIGWVNFVIE